MACGRIISKSEDKVRIRVKICVKIWARIRVWVEVRSPLVGVDKQQANVFLQG